MSKPDALVSLEPGDIIAVSGRVDVDSVVGYRSAGMRLMEEMDTITVDLADSESEGSAAIALLIAWLREADTAGKELTFVGAPPNLIAIADACGVKDILPFA